MRFQVSEMVESPDTELVLRALETNLRTQWSDVACDGNIIVLRGLGPTHRMNRNDRAVFLVKEAEGGKTVIEVDATYLASALVGTGAPQNEIVLRKLDGVLELVRMDVDLAQRRAELEKERGLKPRLVSKNASSSSSVAGLDELEPASAIEVDARVSAHAVKAAEMLPVLTEDAASPRHAPVVDAGKAQEPDAPPEDILQKVLERVAQHEGTRPAPPEEDDDGIGDDIFSPKRADLVARRKAAMQAAQIELEALPVLNGQSATEQRLVHRGEDAATEDEPKKTAERSAGLIFAVLLITFLLAFAAQAGWQYRDQVGQRLAHWRAELSAERVVQNQSGTLLTPEQQAAQQQAERVAAAADAEKAAEASRLAEPDPKKWLTNWADAMKGTDAGVQAAYYADSVDKYFLRQNVSRAEVMAARQDAIAKRKGTWTMRLDDLVIAQQTDTATRVLFVKYIASNDGSGLVEQHLPTQIKLKRMDGQWRIVSEQTLG